MDSLVPAPRAPVHRSLLRFIHDRNPFYLLSALSMFVGFRVILGALDSAPGDWKTLLLLIVTLNVYEAVMIGLALFLIVRRGLRRDGWILLGIEALFLVDLTNLNAELFTAMPRLGTVVNGCCFAMAMIKILVVTRTLGLRLQPRMVLYIAAQMAFLLALPGIFRLMRSSTGVITPMQIYAVWWAVAAMVACGAWMLHRPADGESSLMAALPIRLYVLLPLVSLLVHLCSENRVYWVHFQAANVGPLLLAAVIVLHRSVYRWHPNATRWSIAIVLLAVGLSIPTDGYRQAMQLRVMGGGVSPLRLVLEVGGLMLLTLAWRRRSQLAGVIAVSCIVQGVLGNTLAEMRHAAAQLTRWAFHQSSRLVPESNMQWGYVAIGAAFVLLAVGAIISLRGPVVRSEEGPEPAEF